MCGIATLVEFESHNLAEERLRLMTEAVLHRGPDDYGYAIFSPNLPNAAVNESELKIIRRSSPRGPWVGIGHRRLSILDLSEAGRQPMSDPDQRFWLTYNGEIFNYRELLKDELRVPVKSNSDSEVLLLAYQKWGRDCLRKFNGMWAFAIFDREENRLFAARDRYGVKPLYYAVNNRSFGLSSEIKQLLLTGFGNQKFSAERVSQFLLYGDVNGDHKTCFENIFEVPPGHALTLDLNKPNPRPVISAFYRIGDQYDDVKGLSFEELFESSIALRNRSDVEVGTCLSGGLDSSAIVSATSRLASRQKAKVKTFTAAFPGTRVDESSFSDLVAHRAGTHHFVVQPNLQRFLEELPTIIWHQEEPFRSSSIYAQWCVMRLAHTTGIKVLLDGQGSDEIFAGYHWYLPFAVGNYLGRLHPLTALVLWWKFRSTGVWGSSDSPIRLLLKSLYYASPVKPLRPSPLRELLKTEPMSPSDHRSVREYMIEEMQRSLPSLLRHEDRNSMAFSIEARTPFLDYRIVEFAMNMSDELRFRDGWTKPHLRSYLKRHGLQETALRVDKKGFATPEAEFLEERRTMISSDLTALLGRLERIVDIDQCKSRLSSKSALPQAGLWRLFCTAKWVERFDLS